MGKYEKLKSSLPVFELESTFQAKVNEAKSAYQALEASELAREFKSILRNKKKLESRVKELNIEIEALSQLGLEVLQATGQKTIQLASGGSWYQRTQPHCSIKDRKKLFGWIKQTHQANLLSVQYQALNGLVSERLVAGKPAPPGVEVFLRREMRMTGAN